MLFKYREALSLRDEIGTCPNIEVEIDITDKSPFLIRSYHVREEDKAIIDKEMKRLCYMGILKEGFSAYSSPVMLISRKLTKDKRVVTDFRHLKVRIAKNNLAHPLVRDTFSVLGNSKCEALLVLDLKDAFHSLRLSDNYKEILQNTSIFWQFFIPISRNAYGIKHLTINMAIIHQLNLKLSPE